MEKGLSIEKIKALDLAAQKIGLPELVLIENASHNLFQVIDSLNLGKKVFVVAGRGNNGADVLSCARKLASRGYTVKIVILNEKPLGEQATIQKNILERIGLNPTLVQEDSLSEIKKLCFESDFILEGILGIGIKGELSGFYKSVIEGINQSKKRVVSCDLPSGLSGETGLTHGAAIRADYTVTFIAKKEGFFLNQGPEYCGKIFVVDIGISREILELLQKDE